jgi:hypothetical protein
LLDGSPDPSWPTDGRLIAAGPGAEAVRGIVSDAEGGTIVVWARAHDVESATYGLGLNADGTIAPGWQANGNLIAEPGIVVGTIPDGEGGLWAALLDPRSTPPSSSPDFYYDVYVQRVRGDGSLPPGWPVEGKPVAVADRWQNAIVIAPDLQGGAYLAWSDARNYPETATDVYAQRLTPSGDPAPGWPVNGLPACSFLSFQNDPSIAVDAVGRLVIGVTSLLDNRVYVQHLNSTGTLVNEAEPSGHSVTTGPTIRQERPRLAADGLGNVLAAWQDDRVINNTDIYAKRVVTSPPTATTIALVSAQADPDRVRLEWHAAGDPISGATVYRRDEAGAWMSLGVPHAERDRITFEDVTVSPGARYAYRLGYASPSGETFTVETWVDVPAAHRFALLGARPNPVRDDLRVTFILPTEAAAELEVFDLTGRRIACASLAAPNPGTHHLRLADARRLEAGVYWLRLRQGVDVAQSRVVVVR